MARFRRGKSAGAMSIVATITRAVEPGSVVAVSVGAGAIAAQLGGAILKENATIAKFALGSQGAEALVDVAGGLVIDAGLLVGTSFVLGRRQAEEVAPYVLGGTALSAAAPIIAPYIAEMVDSILAMIAGPNSTAPTFEARTRAALGLPPGGGATIDMPTRANIAY